MVISAYVAGKAGRDAILLSRFSIQSLPLFIGLSAAVSLPVILVAGRLMVRFGPARLVPAMNAVSGLLAIGEYLLLGSYPRPVAVIVFFHLSTASAVLVSGFWSIINERFDIQSAKRYIGRIGLGATLGGILGGVIAERSAVYFERDAILLVLGGLQLACAVALLGFGQRRPRPIAQPDEPKPGVWSSLGTIARSRLLRGIGAIVILSAIAAGVMDYVFKADMVNGTSKDTLLRSLAVFYTITNIITAVVQIAVCGPIISRLGVPRSVATLPVAVTGFGILAVVSPIPLTSTLARAAELITRNSIYRAGYELLYAPLPAHQKRPTKVLLDVGADKIGDILGAQLVGAIVLFAVVPRTALLIATLVVAGLGVVFAMRLPGAYTKALEESLMIYGADAAVDDAAQQAEPWLTLNVPAFGDPGEVVPLRRRVRAKAAPRPPNTDAIIEILREIRSADATRIRTALARAVPVELAPHLVELVGRDDVAREACAALVALAPRCTGVLVDALLDQSRPPMLRRRLPSLLCHGDKELAAWGLWRGLSDPSFDVRYRSGTAVARLVAAGHIKDIQPEHVFETVRRELGAELAEWKTRQIAHDPAQDDTEGHAESGLDHVFRMLGLVLPAEPLRIALHALQADDASLRGMALEYLESILPPDVRAQLWPLLESADSGAARAVIDEAPRRSQDEIAAELKRSYPEIAEKLKHRAG